MDQGPRRGREAHPGVGRIRRGGAEQEGKLEPGIRESVYGVVSAPGRKHLQTPYQSRSRRYLRRLRGNCVEEA